MIHYAVCSGCSPKVLHTLLTVGRAEIYETRTQKKASTSAGKNFKDKEANQESEVKETPKLLPYFSINALYDCISGELIASLSETTPDGTTLSKLGNEGKTGGDDPSFTSTLALGISTLVASSNVKVNKAVECEVRVRASSFLNVSTGTRFSWLFS